MGSDIPELFTWVAALTTEPLAAFSDDEFCKALRLRLVCDLRDEVMRQVHEGYISRAAKLTLSPGPAMTQSLKLPASS